MTDTETHLAVYWGAVEVAQARGFCHGWAAGFERGREVQALSDEELVDALGQYQRDRALLEDDISTVARNTIAARQAQTNREAQRAEETTCTNRPH